MSTTSNFHSEFSESEKLARLRIIRTENVGPITFHKMVAHYGTAERALDALPDMAKRGGRKQPLKPCSKAAALAEIESLRDAGATMLFWGEPAYPKLLAEIEDAPPVLTVRGNTSLLRQPALGIVGSRSASLNGKKLAASFSKSLGAHGYIIVSGLARGIDTAVHEASIDTGTVAVVAGGIDVIYPPENQYLYDQIAATGAIVAENPFGMQPIARHFPRRNRIISGLCLGVLVAEAADKSGSLITARMALEQNRDVFAVPGSPLDPRAAGTKRLLKEGAAHLVETAEDVLNILEGLRFRPLNEASRDWSPPEPDTSTPAEKHYRDILESLSAVPLSIDELIRAVEAPHVTVMTILLELELAGRIERHPGNKVNLIESS